PLLAASLAWGLHLLHVDRRAEIDRAPSGDWPPSHQGVAPSNVVHGGLYDSRSGDDHGVPREFCANSPPLGWSPWIEHHVGMPIPTTQRTPGRLGRAGQPLDPPVEGVTRIAETSCRPGALALRGTDTTRGGKGVRPPTAATAASATAIIASGVTSTTG